MPTSRKIVFYLVAGIFLLLIGLSFCDRADAQAANPCKPYRVWLDGLREGFGEVPAFLAETQQGIVTITLNAETGTWTMLVQPNADIMCMVGSGQGWSAAPESLKGDPV